MLGLFAPLSSHRTTFFAAVLGLFAMGCQARGLAAYPPGRAPTLARAALTATLPTQRTIPLRIVQPVQCDRCTACARTCRNTPPHEDVLESVARANEVFAPTGITFSFQRVERVEAPLWMRHGVRNRMMTWSEVLPEAKAIFPWIPDEAWSNPGEAKASDLWLEVITAVYGRPHEVTIFVQSGGGNRGETHFPNGGRGMWVMDGLFGHGPGRGMNARRDSLYLFSHELGHYFGLRHTFEHAGTNPLDGQPWRLSDRWDLVYHPGSGPGDPHVFFTSQEDAARYPDSELRLIEKMVDKKSNCFEESDGTIECVLEGQNGYSETHRSGAPALKGLSFPLRPAEGGGRYRFGRNALAYGDMEIPRRLSASQIDVVRVFLQTPINVGPRALGRWGSLPDAVEAIPSRRTTLGLPGGE